MAATQIYTSPYRAPVPSVDVATFIFSSGSKSKSQPQYFDADNPSVNYSLERAEAWVKQWAKGIQDLGLRPNEKIMLFAGNSVYFPILFWGVLASECVFTGCSPGSSIDELTYQMKDSDTVLLVTDPPLLNTALKAAERVGLPRSRVLVFSSLGDTKTYDTRTWTSIWASEDAVRHWTWRKLTTAEQTQSTPAVINYSSGTTGLPKGVESSHYNVVANAVQVAMKRSLVAKTPSGKERRRRLDLFGERWLAPLPMFHIYGQTYYCTTAALLGTKVFVMPKYTLEKWLLYMDIYRITFLTGVPTVLVSLSKFPRASNYNLRSVEAVTTGSAPLNAEIGQRVQKMYLRPDVQIKQGWGMTENSGSATGFAADDVDDGRSVGWLHPNMRAKIVPQEGFGGDEGVEYVVGEIWIAGPNVMMGYYKRPRETAAVFVQEGEDRWFRTGDIGYFDDNGKMFIVDRMKELIKVKGLQVAPAEIEQKLLTHPGVQDAAVVGEKRQDGEYPKAFIVAQDPANPPTERQLQEFIEERLSKHKWLTAGVDFLDKIPRTASGKVMRRMLPGQKVAAKL